MGLVRRITNSPVKPSSRTNARTGKGSINNKRSTGTTQTGTTKRTVQFGSSIMNRNVTSVRPNTMTNNSIPKVQTKTAKPVKVKQKVDPAQKSADKIEGYQRQARESAQRRQTWSQSNNPIKRFFGQRAELKQKRQEVRMRKLESEAQSAELSPQLMIEREKTENRLKIAKQQAKAKTAAATALATGAAKLGQGLSDERNQDDSLARKHDIQVIDNIFGDSGTSEADNSGLDSGVE